MTTKSIDAVKLMREIRDTLSREMAHMTSEERIRYIRKLATASDLGKSLNSKKKPDKQ
jgi:pheromone shutdown protein TraB